MSIEYLDLTITRARVKRLAMDACLVRFTINSGGVVTKAPVSGIGASICDQIVQNFLLHLRPNSVGKQENALDLGFRVEEPAQQELGE